MFSSWISLLPFWLLRRFWIWAMDSLSYWFFSLWIYSFLMLSASTASFCKRVIWLGRGVPQWGVFRSGSDATGLWCWGGRRLSSSRLRRGTSGWTLSRTCASKPRFSCSSGWPIESGSSSHPRSGCSGPAAARSSPPGRRSSLPDGSGKPALRSQLPVQTTADALVRASNLLLRHRRWVGRASSDWSWDWSCGGCSDRGSNLSVRAGCWWDCLSCLKMTLDVKIIN